jgi:DNA replication and repair protein RecF
MRLASLSLRQFRSFTRLDLIPGPGLNVLVGPNGAGKSNILEGVAVTATGDSHRDAEPRHWIQDGQNETALVAAFDGEETLGVELRQKRGRARQLKINNLAVARRRDAVGRVPLVAFAPEDLDLVRGEPSVRRRAVNEVLGQLDGAYAEALARYTKVVEERNAALRRVREGTARASMLEPWDIPLLKDGAVLTAARHAFLLELSPRLGARQAVLSSGRDRVTLMYRPSFHMPAEDVDALVEANRRRLADLREGEIALGATLIGPHRDDVEFRLGDDVAKSRASQGQTRTLSLAWKLEERELLGERLSRRPIMIFDDVFSELDPSRRAALTEALTGGQSLVSLTDLASWPEGAEALRRPDSALFHVTSGGPTGPVVQRTETATIS